MHGTLHDRPAACGATSRWRHAGTGTTPRVYVRARLAIVVAIVVALAMAGSPAATAQRLTYRGYAEAGAIAYPQAAPNDDTQVTADVLLRIDPAWQIQRGLTLGASFDARFDTHAETRRAWDVVFWDRTVERPALAIRRLTATFVRGPVSVEVGKQFVRWGQTDILAPTDRFAPRDYVNVAVTDLLAVTAARVTVAGKGHTLESVYTPRLTPSRMPILSHRWIGLGAAADASAVQVRDAGAQYPRRSQFGVRWNHVGRRLEHSIAFFQGFNHLPLLPVALNPQTGTVDVTRRYPAIQVWGGDLVAPLPAFAVKAEAAWVRPRDGDADEYVLYVVQVERQHRDWLFIAGYVGERTIEDRPTRSFEPDRGLARAIVGRASYTLDAHRSLALESVVRRNGDGLLAKAEYAHGLGAHWRVTLRLLLIRGAIDDFLGQYRRNSFGGTQVRYSF